MGSERGASAVEYGLLCAGLLAALVFAAGPLKDTVSAVFANENNGLACEGCSAPPPSSSP